jgi:hypothetical protein
LERRGADVVLWHKDRALVAILDTSPAWRRVYAQGDWVVFVRR